MSKCCTCGQVCIDAVFGVFCMFSLAAEWRQRLSSQTVGWARETFSPENSEMMNLICDCSRVPWPPLPDAHCMVAAATAVWRTDWAGGQNHFSFRKKQQVVFTNCWSMEWRWGTFTLLDVQRDWWITEASLCSLLVVLLQSKKKERNKRNKTTHPGSLIQVK